MMKCIYLLFWALFQFDLAFAIPIKVPQQFYENHIKIDQHPGFAPFISHVNFRQMADFAIDQSLEYFDPDLVKKGDSIYVNIWFLPWFEEYVHDQIKHPYLLISCDVTDRVPNYIGTLNKLLYDPKCAAWFCRNMVFSYHSKLHQVPFGQDLWYWNVEISTVEELKDCLKNRPLEKKHLLYMNHYPRSFGDRDKIVKLFENEPYCFSHNSSQKRYDSISRPEYYQDLSSSVFVISPLGLETDCVRHWEAFAFDCIPIAEHTFLDPLYEGLSIVFVHDWEEIDMEFLLNKYHEVKGKSTEKAYFNYWEQQIKQCQNEIRNHHYAPAQLEASKFDPQDLQDLSSILQNTGAGNVIYRGFLATLRPLELANALNVNISLFDPWLDRDTWHRFGNYLNDFSIFKNKYMVSFFTEDWWDETIRNSRHPIFLDLTYYRNGLVRDPAKWRHSLKKDLENLYQQMNPGTLLCGNMVKNEYVEKVLELLIQAHQWPIEKIGNFWFVTK
jgi:hypothetical protein